MSRDAVGSSALAPREVLVGELVAGGGGYVINATDVPTGNVVHALEGIEPLVAQMVRWAREVNPPSRRGGLLDRDKYVAPGGYFNQVRLAREAMDDDVVSGVYEQTEALALDTVGMFCRDEDQERLWNMWMASVNMDARLREAWMTLYTDSAMVPAMWWGQHTFRFDGKTDKGVAHRKDHVLTVPVEITFLDTLKVTPVGSHMWNREQLAYIAEPEEGWRIDRILARRDGIPDQLPGRLRVADLLPIRRGYRPQVTEGEHLSFEDDPVVEELLVRRYVADAAEREQLARDGVPTDNLFLLNPRNVWRHCLTKQGWRRFPRVRLKSVFPLLDQKANLLQSDRAQLLAAANFIVLITKGAKDADATPAELANLRANVATLAQMPIIVGDWRLHIEIITPKLDMTLSGEKYDTIDRRLFSRLLRSMIGDKADDDPVKMGKVVGQGLQSQRKMIKRSFEANPIAAIRAANPEVFTDRAKMIFHPAMIQLAFDVGLGTLIFDFFSSNNLSRATALGVIGADEDDEAVLVERERNRYDDIFLPQDPHGTANPRTAVSPKTVTRTGGRQGGGTRGGGGAAPGSGQGQAPRGRPKQKRTRKDLTAAARYYKLRGYAGKVRDDLEAMVVAFESENPDVVGDYLERLESASDVVVDDDEED